MNFEQRRLEDPQGVINDLVAQLHEVRVILYRWSNLQGHDLCWHHPEVLTELCQKLGIVIPAGKFLPLREEFREGCRAYESKLYDE